MKKTVLLLIAILITIPSSIAETVTRQQALQKAQQFLQGKNISSQTTHRRLAPVSNENNLPLYIFNVEDNGGFVIVSGEDKTEAILAYSEKGNVDESEMPDNFREWIEGYAQQIKAIRALQSTAVTKHIDERAIPYLIQTKWNQYAPYNNMCPKMNGKSCVTGCTATAMAQVINFHRCPSGQTPSIPSYKPKNFTEALPSLPPTTFNWDLMKGERIPNDGSDAADEVAKLMRYCGQSVKMNYSPSGSGAFVNASNLIHYFGISKTARGISRCYGYSNLEWEAMLYKEVSEGRPVLYCGYTSSAGHEFICDGYSKDGFFHFNWGWGGTYDGYFLTTLEENFSIDQSVIIGIQPDHGEPAMPVLGCSLSNVKSNYSRKNISDDFEDVELYAYLYTLDDEKYEVETAWGIYQNSKLIKTLGYGIGTVVNGSSCVLGGKYDLGGSIPNGTYRIIPLYRTMGNTSWQTCNYSKYNFYEVTIDDYEFYIKMVYFSNNSGITINSVEIPSNLAVGKNDTIQVSITNNGQTYYQYLYLFLNGKQISKAASYIEPGEIGEMNMPFIPSISGQNMLSIACDFQEKNIVYSTMVEISEKDRLVQNGTGLTTTTKETSAFSIIDLTGKVVRNETCSLEGLPNGLYIVKGRLIVWNNK